MCINKKKTPTLINLAEALINEFFNLRDWDKYEEIFMGGMMTFLAHSLCPSESLDDLDSVNNDTFLNIPLLQTYCMVRGHSLQSLCSTLLPTSNFPCGVVCLGLIKGLASIVNDA